MKPGWTGELQIGERWAAWRGAVGDAAVHRHFAAQAVFAPEPVVVEAADGALVKGALVLIDPLVRHRLRPVGRATIVFVEPGSHFDDALRATWIALTATTIGPPAYLAGRTAFWAGTLADEPPKALSPKLTQALRSIEKSLGEGHLDLAQVAAPLGLSSERFRHVFTAGVGLPFSRYVLWRRVRLGVLALSAGQNATAAAHTAGFADLPHFARSLKALFGITASDGLLRR